MPGHAHHYVFDAVPLLDDCIEKLQRTIDKDSRSRHDALYDMKAVLVYTERLLHSYLEHLIYKESRGLPHMMTQQQHSCIKGSLDSFQRVLEEKRRQEELNKRKLLFLNPQDPLPIETNNNLYTTRSATDSLLFRLIVALQLCLVRIDDAHFVITGYRMSEDEQRRFHNQKRIAMVLGASCCCLVGVGVVAASFSDRDRAERDRLLKEALPRSRDGWWRTLASGGAAITVGRMLNSKWKNLWMTDKLYKSTCEIEDWTRQWETVQSTPSPRSQQEQIRSERLRIDLQGKAGNRQHLSMPDILDDKSRLLIEYAMKNNPKSYFWQSQGEIRFLMLKRFMDVYYASVGTAIDSSSSSPNSKWKVPLITGAAASFYSITGTGASVKASYAVNHASRDLIQHAWYVYPLILGAAAQQPCISGSNNSCASMTFPGAWFLYRQSKH